MFNEHVFEHMGAMSGVHVHSDSVHSRLHPARDHMIAKSVAKNVDQC